MADKEDKITLIFQNEEGVPYTEGLCSMDIDLESFQHLEDIAEAEGITIGEAFINLLRKSGLVEEAGTDEKE